jgi:hypothetical protein
LLFLYLVTVNTFVLGHGTKMRHRERKMQAVGGRCSLFAIRLSLFARKPGASALAKGG